MAGFAYGAYAGPIVLMSGMVIAGTWTGSRVLARVDERLFAILFKTALTLVALRLILWEGWKLLQPA